MAHTSTNESIVKRIQNGETELLESLIEANRGIIHCAACRYMEAARRNRAVDIEDLKQSAAMGIIEAVPAWDETRGAFITIALMYMRRNMRAAIGINTSKQRIENMPCASLDAPIEGEQDLTLLGTLADDDAVDPAESAAIDDMRRIVRAAVEGLPERQYTAIKHMIQGGPPAKDERGRAHAFTSLRRNIKLMRLWAEYESAPYRHSGVSMWRNTHISSTEAAVLARERVMESIREDLLRRVDDATQGRPERL